MYLECFTSVKGVQNFGMKFCNIVLVLLLFNCFLETNAWFSRRRRRRFCSPRDCEVSSWHGLLGAHVVLNNVDKKGHNNGQDGEYPSRVVEDQNVLTYRKHGNAMVHDQ